MLTSPQWQRLLARTLGWSPQKYAPLRVVLTDQECERLARDHHVPSERLLPSLQVGWLQKERLDSFAQFEWLFGITEGSILIRPELATVDQRTAAFGEMINTLRAKDEFPFWQSELYACRTSFGDAPLFYFNRGVGDTFGFRQYANHLNGFVRNPSTGQVATVWIAKRSLSKSQHPAKLDTIVGGGLPAAISALENMVKETQEEAGLSPDWTRQRLVSVGSISYRVDKRDGLQNNTMFLYDLEMPEGMTPVNTDNEVESFDLWSIEELVAALREEPELFKPDIALVLLDFLIRHGVLTPDNMQSLQQLERAMRCVAMGPLDE